MTLPVLLVDEGNTRLKCWWLQEGRLHRQAQVATLEALLPLLEADRPERVCLASVRGREAEEGWMQVMSARGLALDVAAVDPARLPTCYQQPDKLGIDRWLAVMAIADAATPALVLDAGTAVTLDVYHPQHGHLGGYILPGLRLQQESLAAQTARVRFPEPDWSGVSPGTDTASSVGHGSVRALTALVKDVAASQERQPVLWLTGGDAPWLLPWLPDAVLAPDLLLRGMARYFQVPLLAGEEA